jgi:hypothetical protein
MGFDKSYLLADFSATALPATKALSLCLSVLLLTHEPNIIKLKKRYLVRYWIDMEVYF